MFTYFRYNQTYFIKSNTAKTINNYLISKLTLNEIFIFIFRQLFSLLNPIRMQWRWMQIQDQDPHDCTTSIHITVLQPLLVPWSRVFSPNNCRCESEKLGQITKKFLIEIFVAVLEPQFSSPRYQILFLRTWVLDGHLRNIVL